MGEVRTPRWPISKCTALAYLSMWELLVQLLAHTHCKICRRPIMHKNHISSQTNRNILYDGLFQFLMNKLYIIISLTVPMKKWGLMIDKWIIFAQTFTLNWYWERLSLVQCRFSLAKRCSSCWKVDFSLNKMNFRRSMLFVIHVEKFFLFSYSPGKIAANRIM